MERYQHNGGVKGSGKQPGRDDCIRLISKSGTARKSYIENRK